MKTNDEKSKYSFFTGNDLKQQLNTMHVLRPKKLATSVRTGTEPEYGSGTKIVIGAIALAFLICGSAVFVSLLQMATATKATAAHCS
jgi:hypothetical protein